MHIDECPFCGGTRHLGFFLFMCEDCGDISLSTEMQDFVVAAKRFGRAVLDLIPKFGRDSNIHPSG